MNQGPNLVTAAAIITVLAAPHPIMAFIRPITDDGDPATAFYIPLSSIAATASHINPAPPRPEQGGQRITLHWLHSLSDESCLWHFRFSAEELTQLIDVLDIPAVFRTASLSKFEAIEALCLLCARFRSSADHFDLTTKYDRSQSAISEIINELVVYLDETWKHLLDFDTDYLLSPEHLAVYAQAIHRTGVPLETVWAFIDCTIIQMCRPTWHQRQVYSGHKRHHALKYQALALPNGLIGHLFGPQEGRRNDNALAAMSRIFENTLEHATRPGTDHNTPVAERYYQIFGDPAYGVTPVILSPFAGPGDRTVEEQEWNHIMSKARISVEHSFGIVLKEWPFIQAHWKHRLYASPLGRYYRIAVLLTNAQGCFRPNQTSQHFACPPPSVQEYFHH